MVGVEFKELPLGKLAMNTGQLEGVPANPRQWTQADVDKLARSISETPELLQARGAIVVPHGKRYVVLGGNMRVTAAKALGLEAVPCAVLPEGTPAEKLREIVIKDNSSFGAWDMDALANEWDDLPLTDWGVPAWDTSDGEGTKPGATDNFEDLGDLKLADRFIVPPFSILDSTAAAWQERKQGWLEKTGNLSTTRDGEYGKVGGGAPTLFATINNGTSNFDPVLAEIIYRWFCPEGGKILDPFGGEQTKGVVAGELGLGYAAVEFRSEQVKLDQQYTSKYKGVSYKCGDSNNIAELVTERGFNLCFTSPPYYDLEVYSKEDMSALGTYEEFMAQYENIFRQCYAMLADDAFLVVKVGEIRDKGGVMRGFVGDNISTMQRIGFKYYNEIILVQPVGTAALRANNSMATRKVVKRHQNVLVFVKGDIKRLVATLPSLDYTDAAAPDGGGEADGCTDIECSGAGAFFAAIKPVYLACSRGAIPTTIPTSVEAALVPFITAATAGQCQVPYTCGPSPVEHTGALDRKKVVLAYTGGKDSTATAINLQRAGYDVTLLFIKNLNKSYPQEGAGAAAIAGLLGLPLVELEVKVHGSNAHPDNPVKNQLILALLADYATAHGIGTISMGVVPVDDANYDYDWSDSRKLMQLFVDYLEGSVPGLKYAAMCGECEADNIATIYAHPQAAAIFQKITSCVGTHRFRTTLRRGNENKYGVKLHENECGSCYKCAYAYITRAALGATYAPDYLARCFEIVFEKGGIYHTERPEGAQGYIRLHFGAQLSAAVYALYTSNAKNNAMR